MNHTAARVLRLAWAGLTFMIASSAYAGETSVRVLPPKRPAAFGRAASGIDVETTGSLVVAQASPGQLAAGPLPLQGGARPALGEREAVIRANATLNGISTLVADFTQVGGDGRRLGGTLSLQRPGKVRFEYDKPSTLEVVSDGSTVLVRDRKLNTSDPYPIGQTPLKFLLSNRIDLTREASLQNVKVDPDAVRITIEDSSTLGGTSKITLNFDRDVTTLNGWRVVDPQGYTTSVALADQDRNKPIDPKTFQFGYSRPVN